MKTAVTDNSAQKILIEAVSLDRAGYTADMEKALRILSREKVTCPLIMVSSGMAARVSGAEDTLREIRSYLLEREMDAELTRIGGIGMSKAEPIVAIQLPGRSRVYFSGIDTAHVASLLDDVFHLNIPPGNLIGQLRLPGHEAWKDVPFLDEIPFFAGQKRLVTCHCGIIDPGSIEEYIARGGYKSFLKSIRHYTFAEICDLVLESGLRGRSGSGFPTGQKWKIACGTPADQRYLICNAEESDPGAFMDRYIMEGDPHLLIEGIAIASYAIGATKAYINIRSEYAVAVERLEEALKQAKAYGFLGNHIFDSGFNLKISLRKNPGAFVCGEETALIRSLEGKRGMPVSKPPYPAESGLHKKPTIINNVETLSNIPLIIGRGPKWYRETGTVDNSGTKLFAISGKIKDPGVIEVPLGTSMKEIVYKIAGGPLDDKSIKAIQAGGPSGCILPASKLDIPVTFEAMNEAGTLMGSGGIVVMDEDVCIIDMVKYYMNFMQKESCGKCIPCREGTRRMSEILEGISRKPMEENVHSTLERFKGAIQLESLASVMKDTALCGLGQKAPNPVLSTLEYFREEYEEHIFDRKCRSNVCTELRSYFIDVDACTGCSLCARKCPFEAIYGTPLHPYFIVSEKCTGCGLCFDSCKFSAISFR